VIRRSSHKPSVSVDSTNFYKLVDIYENVDSTKELRLQEFLSEVAEKRSHFEDALHDVQSLYQRFLTEANRGMHSKMQSTWSMAEEAEDASSQFRHTVGHNFLYVVFRACDHIRSVYRGLTDLAEGLSASSPLALSGNRIDLSDLKSFTHERMQQMAFELELNEPPVIRFAQSMLTLQNCRQNIVNALEEVVVILDAYHKELKNRHSSQGIEIFGDPMITDVALAIYENVDSHGEIEDGIDPDKVSAYSVQKAQVLAEATQTGLVGDFIRDPEQFLTFLKSAFTGLWEVGDKLSSMYEDEVDEVIEVIAPRKYFREVSKTSLSSRLDLLESLDPRQVTYRDQGRLLTSAERHDFNFRRDTVKTIVEMLRETPPVPAAEMVQYILGRKGELHVYHQDENSFYTCKIGSGNQFRGIAPGALEVVPGEKPSINLDHILGEGYDDIRSFITQVENSSKWHDLFVATSPSKTADKSNVLMIGPAGSGKTEVLRGVGADPKSVGIFAQGSDFNTCWMGEASKNPKRLFEAGLKLQKKTNKHVHFLIDEIDSILNNDRHNAGYINLTLEFQILMDGVVHYPNLSVWGTTNHPERIPLPMIRRFSKVAVVGELDQDDRVSLLQHFAGFMPWGPDLMVREDAWGDQAKRLDGATGDVIRKVIDAIWRRRMTTFVTDHEEQAEKLVKWLNREDRFDIREFEGERRATFKRLLSKHVSMTVDDLSESIDDALNNVAILNEIETAKATYERAKLFLTAIKDPDAFQFEEVEEVEEVEAAGEGSFTIPDESVLMDGVSIKESPVEVSPPQIPAQRILHRSVEADAFSSGHDGPAEAVPQPNDLFGD